MNIKCIGGAGHGQIASLTTTHVVRLDQSRTKPAPKNPKSPTLRSLLPHRTKSISADQTPFRINHRPNPSETPTQSGDPASPHPSSQQKPRGSSRDPHLGEPRDPENVEHMSSHILFPTSPTILFRDPRGVTRRQEAVMRSVMTVVRKLSS